MTWFVPSPILVQPHRIASHRKKSANCVNLFPKLFRIEKSSAKADSICPHDESSQPVLQIDLAILWKIWFGTWFSWFGKNAKTCWDGPDKMPTKKLGRTKCQPQKKVRTKCQPLVGIMSGWHFVRLAFCPTTIRAPDGANTQMDNYVVYFKR